MKRSRLLTPVCLLPPVFHCDLYSYLTTSSDLNIDDRRARDIKKNGYTGVWKPSRRLHLVRYLHIKLFFVFRLTFVFFRGRITTLT